MLHQKVHKSNSKISPLKETRPRSGIAQSHPESEPFPVQETRALQFNHDFTQISVNHSGSIVPIQPKLMIGQPGDKYEQEADSMARQVVQQIHAPAASPEVVYQLPNGFVQRFKADELQLRDSQNEMAAMPELEASIQQARGRGQPLTENIREPMQRAFGTDFSGVKIHTDAQSNQFNQSLQAKAFTTGQDIFFRQGAYEPGSRGGKALIAHELTHVMQQSGGMVQQMQRKGLEITASPVPPMIQRVKVGMELTFSNEDLFYMPLSEEDYKKNPKEGKKTYEDYTSYIKKTYVDKWAKAVEKKATDKNSEMNYSSQEVGVKGKGDAKIGAKFTYGRMVKDGTGEAKEKASLNFMEGEEKEPIKDEKSPIEKISQLELEGGEKISSIPKSQEDEPVIKEGKKEISTETNNSKVITAREKGKGEAAVLPREWWWDIDPDPACLEVRAEPLSLDQYKHPDIAKIIQEDIFDIALNELGLKTGYAGQGGGHLSVDYKTGFDSNPENVAKTLAWMELNQKAIDERIATVDVLDDKNAPYLFDPNRTGGQAFKALSNWLIEALQIAQAHSKNEKALEIAKADSKNKKTSEIAKADSENEEQSPESKPKTPSKKLKKVSKNRSKQSETKKPAQQVTTNTEQEPKVESTVDIQSKKLATAWTAHLKKLAGLLQSHKTSAQKKDQFTGPGGDWRQNLHYQEVNLEHTLDAIEYPNQISTNDAKASVISRPLAIEEKLRVEFRRLVAQRSYEELVQQIDFVLKLVEEAKSKSVEELVRSVKNIEKPGILRDKKDIAKNQGKADEQKGKDWGGEIPKGM